MRIKVIGALIIFFGFVLLSGFVYFIFFNDLSLAELAGKYSPIKKGTDSVPKDTVDEVTDETQAIDETINNVVIPDKKIIEVNKIDETELPQATKQDFTKADLRRMAASFAERFGSYSNQSNFNNITDIKIFMSERMKEWADSFVAKQRGLTINNDIYYGITTKAVSEQVKKFDEDAGRAAVLVSTRRREATGATTNYANTKTQDILINFVKEKGAWKVDSANWIE